VNPALLFAVSSLNKKQIYFVMATLAVIVSLPVIAVFSLGTAALSFLSGSSSGSDTTYAISTTSQGIYEGPEIAGDTYAWGNCTYWAYAQRLAAHDPIPTSWGNANTWDDRARAGGYLVDHDPSVGAVFQTDNGDLGHVAYVTAVDPITGNWTISEMNAIGLNIVDLKTYPAATELKYNFIHDKEIPNAL
jgi:surface antigen